MRVRTVLLVLTLFLTSASLAGAQNLLANGGFEADGAVGAWVGTSGWTMAPGSFAMLGTDSSNPHSGSYSWEIGAYGTTGLSYTVPMLSQEFSTSASTFVVSGWVRTNAAGTALVRIRENKTGGPGTVRCFKNGAWGTTAWGIAASAGQTSWDAYGMNYFGSGLDENIVMSNVPNWTYFSFPVSALPGVTDYSIDISCGNTGAVGGGDAWFDDFSVTNAQEILVNGGFEADGPVGMWYNNPTGWTIADGSFVSLGTDATNPRSGLYDFGLQNYSDGGAYTVPMMSQVFSTTASDSNFTVSGWVRTNAVGTASIRIRENLTGAAGTVPCFRNGTWGTNTWPIASTAGQTAWDAYAMDLNDSFCDQAVAITGVSNWTYFSVAVPTINGVTSYSLDLSAGHGGGIAYFDDLSVTTPVYGLLPPVTVPTNLRNPFEIEQGTATVDGDISEWANAQWTQLSTVYDGSPSDIAGAWYAARWQSDKVYVAVKVRDTAHYFTNAYTDWNARDAIEVYLHTNGSGSIQYPNEEQAQDYVVGINKSDNTSLWTCMTNQIIYTAQPTHCVAIPSSAGFSAAGKVVGDWIYYELALTPFQYFGGLANAANVPNTLESGNIIGLDVCVASANAAGTYKGMVAENSLSNKADNYNQFGRHQLDTNTVPQGGVSLIKTAADGSAIEVNGAVVTSRFYDVDASQANYQGVCFGIETPTRENGARVLWNWTDSDATRAVQVGSLVNLMGTVSTVSGERVFSPSNVVVMGASASIPAALGLSNKATGGEAASGALLNDAVAGAASAGLNNTGLLVTIWGKVTKSYTDLNRTAYFDGYYFYVDDGSGLSDGSGFTGIMCRAAGDGGGPYDPTYTPGLYAIPDAGRYVSVTGVVGTQLINGKQVRYFWTKSWNYQD